MTKKATTKDELFLVKLQELAAFDPIDRYIVGRAIGANDKMIDNIVRHLAQANFIKKVGESEIHLTKHGAGLVELLLR